MSPVDVLKKDSQVQVWISRLKHLVEQMPDTVKVNVHGSTIDVLLRRSERYEIVESIEVENWYSES